MSSNWLSNAKKYQVRDHVFFSDTETLSISRHWDPCDIVLLKKMLSFKISNQSSQKKNNSYSLDVNISRAQNKICYGIRCFLRNPIRRFFLLVCAIMFSREFQWTSVIFLMVKLWRSDKTININILLWVPVSWSILCIFSLLTVLYNIFSKMIFVFVIE